MWKDVLYINVWYQDSCLVHFDTAVFYLLCMKINQKSKGKNNTSCWAM